MGYLIGEILRKVKARLSLRAPVALLILVLFLNLLFFIILYGLDVSASAPQGYIRINLANPAAEMEIPRSWLAITFFQVFARSGSENGSRQVVSLRNLDADVSITIYVYNQQNVDRYLKIMNISTVEESVKAEILGYFNLLHQNFQNSTLEILETAKMLICNATATYKKFLIKGVLEEALKGVFLSLECSGMVQIIYLGTEKAWDNHIAVYEHLISTMRLK